MELAFKTNKHHPWVMFINLYFRRSTPVATAENCSFKVVLQIATCSGGRWPSEKACNLKIKVNI